MATGIGVDLRLTGDYSHYEEMLSNIWQAFGSSFIKFVFHCGNIIDASF